jgi:hypothetical protein
VEQTFSSGSKTASVEDFVREIAAAAKKLALYPSGHPAAAKAAQRPFAMLELLLRGQENVVVAYADGKLVGDGQPMDDRLLHDGLGRVMAESGIQSIGFGSGITIEQFAQFIGQLSVKAEEQDLIGFLEANKISNIIVDRWHYELVGDDQKIVDADAVVGKGEGGDELKQSLADLVKERPGMIVTLLCGGRMIGGEKGRGAGYGTGGGAATIASWQISGSGDAPNGGSGEGEVIGLPPEGTGTGEGHVEGVMKLPDPEQALKDLDSLTDDELIQLLAAGLSETVDQVGLQGSFDTSQVLMRVKELLEKREDPALIRRLKNSLRNSNIIDEKYLNLIFDSNASLEDIAFEETLSYMSQFLSGEPDPDKVGDFYGWFGQIEDDDSARRVTTDLIAGIAENRFSLSADQEEFLESTVELITQNLDSTPARAFSAELLDRLVSELIQLPEIRFIIKQLEPIYFAALEQGNSELAVRTLNLIKERAFGEAAQADGVTGLAVEAHQVFCSAQAVDSVLQGLVQRFTEGSKDTLKLLEMFTGRDAALVFTKYLTHSERGLRLLMIRLLSEMGEHAVEASRIELAELTSHASLAAERPLPEQPWYKLRNIALVLGNTGHPDAVELLEPLSDYADERLVEEVVAALEKLDWEDSTRILARLLSHPARSIHTKALRAISSRNREVVYPLVEDYFLRHPSERKQVLPILSRLDKVQAGAFLAAVLEGESDAFRQLYAKPDESLNMMIVETFIHWRSAVTDDVLRRYVRSATGTIFSRLRKPASVKHAEKYLRSLSA